MGKTAIHHPPVPEATPEAPTPATVRVDAFPGAKRQEKYQRLAQTSAPVQRMSRRQLLADQKAVLQPRAKLQQMHQQMQNLDRTARGFRGQSGPATEADIATHDGLMESGQHHAVRQVTYSQLAGDLEQKSSSIQGYHARDTKKLSELMAKEESGKGGKKKGGGGGGKSSKGKKAKDDSSESDAIAQL